jgi:hypothetical protein
MLSEKCKERLSEGFEKWCNRKDLKKIVMCRSAELRIKERMGYRDSIKQAWREAKQTCER